MRATEIIYAIFSLILVAAIFGIVYWVRFAAQVWQESCPMPVMAIYNDPKIDVNGIQDEGFFACWAAKNEGSVTVNPYTKHTNAFTAWAIGYSTPIELYLKRKTK